MSRPLLGLLLRCWLGHLLPALLLGALAAWLLLWRLPLTLLIVLMAVQAPLWAFASWAAHGVWRPSLWLWRFSRRVVGFRGVPSERVDLLVPADLEGRVDLGEIAHLAGSDLDDLEPRFGFPLRRRLTIVLVSSHTDLEADFGRPMGGTVLVPANAVILAADCPIREGLRHELVHLFAARWNGCPPPLVEEGLAVWLQENDSGRLDRSEDISSLSPESPDPLLLLDRRYFFAAHRLHLSYTLAGVFTGFLVRRFGWDRYRELYRRADRWSFRTRFAKHYGMSLEEAWSRCHQEAAVMATLNRRLR